ncbi:Small nuclear ribonucleoprotein-associated protein N [Fukomys damarensis]|uniref:Small nuclear ribonucleoprotein-associated protein N n=1 Tax=Fukomys damarensis TaxID=885580 RepID=A0A091DFE3_FUKDA|nr:Small nuclear ribonucleoprotein-associated protein N [Fukomys damarensis]
MGKSSKMPQHHDDRMPRVPQSAGSSLTPLRPFVQPRNLVRCDCEEFRKTKPRSAEQPEWEESGPGSVLVPVWVEGPPLSSAGVQDFCAPAGHAWWCSVPAVPPRPEEVCGARVRSGGHSGRQVEAARREEAQSPGRSRVGHSARLLAVPPPAKDESPAGSSGPGKVVPPFENKEFCVENNRIFTEKLQLGSFWRARIALSSHCDL